MTSKEFILWLKGFTEGVHEFNITPKQWDTLKEKLAEVDDNPIPIGGLLTDYNKFGTVTATSYPSGSSISYTTYQPINIKTDTQNKFKKRKAKSVKEWEDTHDLGGQD